MPRTPRIAEYLLGASVIFAVVMSVRDGTPLEFAVAAIPLVVGILLLLERPLRRPGSLGQTMASLPAMALAGPVLAAAAPWSRWDASIILMLASGVVITVVSLATLGRSFGVLPAARRPVDRGPYRWIRHPAYLGQWLILAACGLSTSPQMGGLIAIAAIPILGLRIRAEEQLLGGEWSVYREYMERVRWRLFPLVW